MSTLPSDGTKPGCLIFRPVATMKRHKDNAKYNFCANVITRIQTEGTVNQVFNMAPHQRATWHDVVTGLHLGIFSLI